jgi:hypothetical protein
MNGLKHAYRTGKVLLFAGAGVSANLGLPNWSQLIARIAQELDYDPSVFGTYGGHLELAEFYKLKKGSIGALRSWMDREWHKPDVDIKSSEIHRLIAQGNFSRIYTTNYDRWLERAHEAYGKPFVKVTNVADLAKVNDSDRQIIKFHGDFDDDTSIVLDETSYFERLSLETPLDIKLRADVLGTSVLFIGYSISDPNMRLLFYRLTKMWSHPAFVSTRPNSYLFSHRPNPVAEEILSRWGIRMIVPDDDDPKRALTSFLNDLVS